MDILYYTDPHVTGRNPGARLDNYYDAVWEKHREIEKACRKRKPDALVVGGDLFDSPRIADSIKNRYIRFFRRIRKMGIPVYLVPGNHDEFGYTLDTIDQTAIGILAASGHVTLLTKKRSHSISGKDGIVVEIHGREYDKDIDKDPVNDYQIKENRQADYNILFAHGMLLDKPFHPDVRYTLTKDVVTNADAVLVGHYHPGFDVHEENGVIFANPGSTGRDEICDRIPQYAWVEANQKGITITYHEYKCAKPANEIFDFSVRQQKKDHTRYLEAFEQTVQDALQFDSFDPKDTLQKMTGVDQAIVNKAFSAIVEAEKAVKTSKLDGYVVKSNPLGIASVQLVNFMSYSDQTIKFSPTGLNAITGVSDSGKTTILRGIRWCLHNEPKGTDFIREGESRATVKVTFTDGSYIVRSRTNSSAGEYIVGDGKGNETEFKGFGSDLPVDIANVHQMPRVELAPGVERCLNIQQQLDGHFLLSESVQMRAAVIGRLTGTNVVDAAIKSTTADLRRATIDYNSSQQRIDDLDSKLANFGDIPIIEQSINIVKGLVQLAERDERDIKELEHLYRSFIDADNDVITFENALMPYDRVDRAEPLLDKAELLSRDIQDLMTLARTISDEVINIKDLQDRLVAFQNIDDVEHLIEEAHKLHAEIVELTSLRDEARKAKNKVDLYKTALEDYKGLKKAEKLIAKAERLSIEIIQLQVQADDLKHIDTVIERQEKELVDAAKMTRHIEKKIEELVEEMGGRCPTCNQEVDAEHLLEHVG